MLLGYALAGLKRLDEAVAQLEQALVAGAAGGDAFSNLGTLQMARGDLAKLKPRSGRPWRSAPMRPCRGSPSPTSSGRVIGMAEAEACLVKARQLDPNDLVAARALATLYMTTNRAAEAEPDPEGSGLTKLGGGPDARRLLQRPGAR